jgi:hypothetical protein
MMLALTNDDLDAARGTLRDDAPIHLPYVVPLGDLQGARGLLAVHTELLQRTDQTFLSTRVGIVGHGDIVVTTNQVSANRGGRTITYHTAWTVRFAGEEIVEIWVHPSCAESEIADFYGFDDASRA